MLINAYECSWVLWHYNSMIMSALGHLWVLMNAHECPWSAISTNKHGSMVPWALMCTNECSSTLLGSYEPIYGHGHSWSWSWCRGAMSTHQLPRVFIVLMAPWKHTLVCTWVTISAQECTSVVMSGHECSLLLMSGRVHDSTIMKKC